MSNNCWSFLSQRLRCLEQELASLKAAAQLDLDNDNHRETEPLPQHSYWWQTNKDGKHNSFVTVRPNHSSREL